jgi:hypothetical protein
MTHEEILNIGFSFSPTMFKTLPPYRKGDGSFNRYEHSELNVVMQHYVDDDRFVIQGNTRRRPHFNGYCRDTEELGRAIRTGSVFSAGDSVAVVNSPLKGFLFFPWPDDLIGKKHAVFSNSGFLMCESRETSLVECRMVLTEKDIAKRMVRFMSKVY